MEITEKDQEDIKIFELNGRLDSNTSPEFEEKITGAIQNGSQSIVINFEGLDYISSAGLRVILKAAKELKRTEGQLILASMKDYVKEVFEIAGFDSFLPITPTMEEALERF